MVFVFGSNLAGIHGAGAAAYALKHHGARWGRGVGRQGDAYAIPTKDEKIKTLPLAWIERYVQAFLRYARTTPNEQYLVTAIGTGLAGYTHDDIAPMFLGAPTNCYLPAEWTEILKALDAQLFEADFVNDAD